MKSTTPAAYQGVGWKPRTGAMATDVLGPNRIWQNWQVNSEWSDLKVVALYTPGRETQRWRSPKKMQHLECIDPNLLRREMAALQRTFKKLGIEVLTLRNDLLPKDLQTPPPNLMFVRDLFFNTPEGCVISRMASRIRAGEEKFASASLAAYGLPIRLTLGSGACFEGADALWLNPRTVLCGVGQRTNRQGFSQLSQVLRWQGIQCLAVSVPKGVQHLLGVLQIVGPDLAVIRRQKVSTGLLNILKKYGYRCLEVMEGPEVKTLQGMNFVTIGRQRIIMAKHCPELRTLLQSAGLKVAAEVEISQLCRAAGGLACATGIVYRKRVEHD